MATRQKDWKSEWEKLSKESRKLAKRANQRLKRLETYSERKGLSNILKFAYGKAQQYIKANIGVGKSNKGRFKEHIKLYEIDNGSGKLEGNALYRANVMIQKQRIKAMEEFLGSQSSTLGQSRAGKKTKGIKNINDQRSKTITDRYLSKYGLELDASDLKRFFESKKQAKIESQYGSLSMFIVAAVMKKYNIRSTKRELEKFFKSHVDLTKYEDITKKDLKVQAGETKDEYLDRLSEFVDFTGDEVLDNFVINALKEGIDVKSLFI